MALVVEHGDIGFVPALREDEVGAHRAVDFQPPSPEFGDRGLGDARVFRTEQAALAACGLMPNTPMRGFGMPSRRAASAAAMPAFTTSSGVMRDKASFTLSCRVTWAMRSPAATSMRKTLSRGVPVRSATSGV